MNLLSYLILFVLVVLARLFVTENGIGQLFAGTQVSAVTQSPAEPVVVYQNPIDQYVKENYPNAT